MLKTSQQGIGFLERHEGVVLRAYRCPAGIWTIGVGLTAASGVIKPAAGMVITRKDASRLLALALNRNYEPAVRATMPGARQHEFDAGVSFHFNTGAIGRASWVRKWIERDWNGVKTALNLWNKGGGKVLPGLIRRRAEEFALLSEAHYGAAARAPAAMTRARYVAPITAEEIPAIRAALGKFGYAVGDETESIPAAAVRQFQADHGLTEDGIIGRATAETLQRVLDARAKAALPAGAAIAGTLEAVPGEGIESLAGIPWAGEIILFLAALRGIWLAWQYRDAIAPLFDKIAPRIAVMLRSF